jgi:hypothetical protein
VLAEAELLLLHVDGVDVLDFVILPSVTRETIGA